jgi:hypothetical protein
MEFCRGTHKIVLLERALLVVKKRYGIRRNKIFILTFYTTIIGGVIFFNSYWKVKKSAIWGFKLIKKLSPDRSVFKPFKLVVILLALED